jgi:CRISPR-associated protein Csh1
MIREIINLTKILETDLKDVLNNKISPQQEGLYVVFSKDGTFKTEFYKDGGNITPLLVKCIEWLRFSWTIEYEKKPWYQKCFDLPNKRIHSVSPFLIAVKRKYLEAGKEFSTKKVDVGYIKKYLDKAITETVRDKQTRDKALLFQKYIDDKFQDIIIKLKDFKWAAEDYVLVFFDTELDDYKNTYRDYLKTRIFNSSKQGLTDSAGISINEKKAADLKVIRGWSNFFNGYNAGKPFLQHQTSLSATNTINNEDAYYLFLFNEYWRMDVFPNPMPIFIDFNELKKDGTQSEVIKLYNVDRNKKLSYREVVSSLLDKKGTTLQKYYLLFRVGTEIFDFDYVPLFRYKFDSTIIVKNVTEAGYIKDKAFEKDIDERIDNVFDFERIVVRTIFNNALVKKKEDRYTTNYFGEIKPEFVYGGDSMWQLIMKYRKAFYDYIYKSKTNAITATMFDDMMFNSILSNIRQDEIKTRCEYNNTIKTKINIWFSIYNLFNINKKDDNMASTVIDLLTKIKAVAKGESNIESPEEFAFCAGQLASYLIDRSAASNKTYAMLEPYLQKSKSGQLQDAIAQTIAVYKHDISVYKGTFELLSAQVLTYDEGADMKPLLKYFLAGCFCPCVVYTKKDESNNYN